MQTFLLIGGIGSGKSSTTKIFTDLGAYTFDLDQVGHDVLRHPGIIGLIKQTFGRDVVDDDGQIDHVLLAKKAFASDAMTQKLNEITHPEIMEEAQRRIELAQTQSYPFALVEISAYNGPGTLKDNEGFPLTGSQASAKFYDNADGIIAVLAPRDVRIERACAEGFKKDDVIRRIAQQPTDDQRRAWADYVIENDKDIPHLVSQVHTIYQQIVNGAHPKQ